jgi:hypothetical protein
LDLPQAWAIALTDDAADHDIIQVEVRTEKRENAVDWQLTLELGRERA